MATRDYSKPEAQANQQSQQTAAAPPAMETGQSQLTAIVTQLVGLLETQNRLLQRQVQSPTVRGFERTPAEAVAKALAFNDIVLDLKLKFSPTAPTLVEAAKPSLTEIQLTWTENTNNPDGYKVYRRQGSTGEFVEITVNPL